MTKLTKIISNISVAIIAFSFIGCGSAPKAEKKANTKAPSNDEIEPTKNVLLKNPKTDYSSTELPDTEFLLLDDFEDGNYWYSVGSTWDQWGTHNLSLSADLSKDWKSNGEYSLKCTMEAATKDSSLQASWCGTPADSNLSGFKWVVVDIYNPENFEYELNIAVQNKINWSWEETTSVIIPKGVHTALFDISGMKNEYMRNAFLFMIQSINEHNAGTIYFDNFRLYK